MHVSVSVCACTCRCVLVSINFGPFDERGFVTLCRVGPEVAGLPSGKNLLRLCEERNSRVPPQAGHPWV